MKAGSAAQLISAHSGAKSRTAPSADRRARSGCVPGAAGTASTRPACAHAASRRRLEKDGEHAGCSGGNRLHGRGLFLRRGRACQGGCLGVGGRTAATMAEHTRRAASGPQGTVGFSRTQKYTNHMPAAACLCPVRA